MFIDLINLGSIEIIMYYIYIISILNNNNGNFTLNKKFYKFNNIQLIPRPQTCRILFYMYFICMYPPNY